MLVSVFVLVLALYCVCWCFFFFFLCCLFVCLSVCLFVCAFVSSVICLLVCSFLCVFVWFACLFVCHGQTAYSGLTATCMRTSMTELLVNFIFTTGTRPPVNVNRFRDGKRPAYAMRDRCTHDLPLQAFTFAEDLRTFQAALKWFRKRAKVDLLPGDFVVNCRSLYVLGYSRPTKGISYRIRHVCEPDPRAHLQDLFMQRSARKWRFDFHINPPHVNIPRS